MLGVADPDASGIGGITYMLIQLADRRMIVIDGTPPVPRKVDPARLLALEEAGQLPGHELTAVPTTLAVLEHARSLYGTMDMATLLTPSIAVAENGYRLGPAQIVWNNVYFDRIVMSKYLKFIALEDGATIGNVGDIICRPDLARTLRFISRHGISSFYRGPIADIIEADMIRGGGFVRKADLARLRVKEVYPIHTRYRDVDVFTVPQPAGGVPVIEILNILENFSSSFVASGGIESHHAFLETLRIAFADRVLAPEASWPMSTRVSPALSRDHARHRSNLIEQGHVIPGGELFRAADPECLPAGDSTTQVSVADRLGNVVSLTQTLGRAYGAEVATPGLGFPYNSMLEAFNFDRPQCPGYLNPNSLCSNDMAPTIVLADDGSLVAALGAPSSNRIPSILANVFINLIDRGMQLDEAIDAPKILYGGYGANVVASIEVFGSIRDADVDALEALGHENIERYYYHPPISRKIVRFGGVNAVGWDAEAMTFVGVGDGRRWGSAKGPRVVAEPTTAH
jgi:gamma-glutamyltranspeptidase/glutathione hydrolase